MLPAGLVSRLLLGPLVRTVLPTGAPLVLAADEALERRRGAKIACKSLFFGDPVRSGSNDPLKREGIRWLRMALLVEVPGSQKRRWALPFLTVPVLAPATPKELGKAHLARWSIGHGAIGAAA